ncbi:hypothetical protein EGJ27_19140 [Pseudomonas sp. v388]|uniref:hypothetical protein n=1 Tax=Pseudomonas sp. v388 TaxID=2479849 RepID=UPI000F76D3F5|nr:hypothetical protein [Pseudomonas sp. v388]RRV05285.1 hypothetical protein EGJ27_19140 [Pseudomonas sp. v388]
MQLEPLKDMQDYLKRTADDLERVSRNLAGHMRYLQHSSRIIDAQDVNARIQGLQASANDLRQVFKK